jgi:hypothetical protein
VNAEELLKSVGGVVADFKKESGSKNASEAITELLSGLMLYCSENNLEFEDFCDAADKQFDELEAELDDEGNEDLEEDDDDADDDADDDEVEEADEEEEDEEDFDEDDVDEDDDEVEEADEVEEEGA